MCERNITAATSPPSTCHITWVGEEGVGHWGSRTELSYLVNNTRWSLGKSLTAKAFQRNFYFYFSNSLLTLRAQGYNYL